MSWNEIFDDDEIEICEVQLPGRENRIGEAFNLQSRMDSSQENFYDLRSLAKRFVMECRDFFFEECSDDCNEYCNLSVSPLPCVFFGHAEGKHYARCLLVSLTMLLIFHVVIDT